MTKRGILSLVVLGLVLGFNGLSEPVSAAACSNTSSFGAVLYQVPDVTNTKNQKLWVRMQGNPGDSILVELNGSECYELKLQGDSSESWSWQTLQSDDSVLLVTFPKSKGNSLKVIGTSSGVKVDRLLITDPECEPEDFGNNCRSSVPISMSGDSSVVALASLAQPVNGQIHLSPTAQSSPGRVSQMEYVVNGRIVQQATKVIPLDTTLLENGRHTIHITTVLAGDETVREMIAIDIKNPENALTPIIRWVKYNQAWLAKIGLVLAALGLVVVVSRLLIKKRKSRRERTFRGL